MTQPEYEQRKRECWAKFCQEKGIDQCVIISIYEAFDYIFDHAYTLGKPFGKSEQLNAEGEEMLTVKAKTIREMYAANERIMVAFRGGIDAIRSDSINHVLRQLFGSKCLPDNDDTLEPNDDTLELKPTEPRFKAGEVAIISHGFKHPLVKDGDKVIILSYHEKGDFYSCAISENLAVDVDAKHLEPDTPPSTRTAWIARDEDGNLYMYKVKPYRGKGDYSGCWDSDGYTLALGNHLFQSVTWESEPLEVTISITPTKNK